MTIFKDAKAPRYCSFTGTPMWDGFVLWDGELYAHNIDLVCSWLRSRNVDPDHSLSDEYILKEAYECDEYYWSTWYDEPPHLWHHMPEQLVSLESTDQ